MGQPEYQFTPAEYPILPGGPYSPSHATWRRVAYAGVACVTGVGATLGNALISTNTSNIAGSLGEYVATVTLLPAIYVAITSRGNLLLVKSRLHWGIPAVTQGVLAVNVLAALVQLAFPTFVLAVVARAASGLTAAALIAVTIFYLLQVFPPKLRPAALVIGIGLTQLGIPIARLFPVEMLAQHHWRTLHLVELTIPLAILAVVQSFPLPPSNRGKAFEPLRDLTTVVLVVPAMLLISLVLSGGRLYWWT